MPIIVLNPGDTIRVEIAESDGGFDIAFTETSLTVSADLPGSHLGGEGLIYREVFAGCTCDVKDSIHREPTEAEIDPKCPEHGEFGAMRKAAV